MRREPAKNTNSPFTERPRQMESQSFESPKTPFFNPLQIGQELSSKMIEFSGANVSAALNFAVKLSSVRSPGDFTNILANHASDNLKMLTEELEELSSIIRKSSGMGERSRDTPLGS